ncbi:MAG: bestrophin-like domain, partial [Candidatus Binataceae bacterium]
MHSGRIEPKSVKDADTKNTVHMKMGGVFANIDAWRTAATLGLAMFAAWQLGRWRGRRLQAKSGNVPVSKFEDASLALLGLLLAFSFSLAIVKHDQRRTTLLADTNAIGDFYTCASLIKEPVRTKLQSVIRDYTELRVELSGRRIDEAMLENALGQMQQMQFQMTALVDQALVAGTPIAVPLTNTLNGLISNHASRLAAIRDRLPTGVVALLLLTAVVASMLVGREQGASENADLAGTIC